MVACAIMAPRKGEAMRDRASRLLSTYGELISKDRFLRVTKVPKENRPMLREIEDIMVDEKLLGLIDYNGATPMRGSRVHR